MKPSEALKDIRVEYECSVTVNTGNFSNIKPSYKASATVADGSNPHEVRQHLKGLVDGWLSAEVADIQADLNG